MRKRRGLKAKINQTRSERQRKRERIEYAELDKKVKKGVREDKRQFVEELAETAEVAASKNELRTVYKITQRSVEISTIAESPLIKHGNLGTSEPNWKPKVAEHFSKILKRPDPENPPDITLASEDLDISTNPPTWEEIIKAIKSLKNNKSP